MGLFTAIPCNLEPFKGAEIIEPALEYDFGSHTPQRLGGLRGFAGLFATVFSMGGTTTPPIVFNVHEKKLDNLKEINYLFSSLRFIVSKAYRLEKS